MRLWGTHTPQVRLERVEEDASRLASRCNGVLGDRAWGREGDNLARSCQRPGRQLGRGPRLDRLPPCNLVVGQGCLRSDPSSREPRASPHPSHWLRSRRTWIVWQFAQGHLASLTVCSAGSEASRPPLPQAA